MAGLFRVLVLAFPWIVLSACTPAEAFDPPSDPSVLQESGTATSGSTESDPYEVWVVDQSDSDGDGGFGGTVYIYDGGDFASIVGPETSGGSGGGPIRAPEAAERIDLGAETAAVCSEATGSNPVRPHMLLFNDTGTHAVLAFVGSGHVVVLEAESRSPLACFRMSPGAGGAQQAHAAFPTPDGRFILVANQNGKLLERIDTDWTTGSYRHNTEATLDLAGGTTPSGALREDPELRPDNAPICPVVARDGSLAWVTLRGGGLFVVDVESTPMRIVAEYDRDSVKGNGCGGVEAGGSIFLNSGGSPIDLGGEPHAHLHLYGFDVYRFPLDGYDPDHAPNLPTPEVVFEVDGTRDSHGMASVRNDSHLWVLDRHMDVAEVLSVTDGTHLNTVELNGPLTGNAAPDLVDVSPDGHLLFVALRGSVPLTGDPHNATGATPGLGIIRIAEEGTSGELVAISRIENRRGGVDYADPHGLRVRRR